MLKVKEPYITDIGIAVTGSADSGKSTFIGVLTTGILDDGNGKARESVAKHPHELTTGKTSDISTRIFPIPKTNRAITMIDLCGQEKYLKTTTYGISGHFPDYGIIIIAANRGILPMTKQHITLLKYLNIPIFIIFTRVDIAPEDTYKHGKKEIKKYFSSEVKMPVQFMNDYYDKKEIEDRDAYVSQTVAKIVKLIRPDIGTQNTGKQLIVPVISVSNKTGFCIDLVKGLLETLKPVNVWNSFDYSKIQTIVDKEISDFGDLEIFDVLTEPEKPLVKTLSIKNPLLEACTNRVIANMMKSMNNPSIFPTPQQLTGTIFYIDSTFAKSGIKLILSGINRGNEIRDGDTLYIGPFIGKDSFNIELKVRSIHNGAREQVDVLEHHHRGCLAVVPSGKKDNITRDLIKKGMILINPKSLSDNVCFHFEAAIEILDHPSTLKTGYCPHIHMGTIRQTVRMTIDPKKNNGNEELRLKDHGIVTFKFRERPEFIELYQLFAFRSGSYHGTGIVIGFTPINKDDDAKPDPIKIKRRALYKKNKALRLSANK